MRVPISRSHPTKKCIKMANLLDEYELADIP
jgi:hypothetical protein